MISTPISVNRIKISGELPSHQRSFVNIGRCPTEYSSPMRKLVTRFAVGDHQIALDERIE